MGKSDGDVIKVLIVDDEDYVVQSLGDLLRLNGFDVEAARDGEEALDAIEKRDYDLILCDIKMPNIGGIEVLERAKEKGKAADFIMISGVATKNDAIASMKLGASDFIEKPYESDEVLHTIRRTIELRKLGLERDRLLTELKRYSEQLEQRVAERTRELEELKRFNEDIVRQMGEGIMIQNTDGCITFVNPQVERLSGYSREYLIGKHWSAIISPTELKNKEVEELIRSGGKFEAKMSTQKKEEVYFLVTTTSRFEGEEYRGSIVALSDITEIKKKEEKLVEKSLKYNVKKGKMYLIEEGELDMSIDLFQDLLDSSYRGLIISRTNPDRFKRFLDANVPIVWLSKDFLSEMSMPPDLTLISSKIKDFIGTNKVILLDRIDYLIANNTFDRFWTFVQWLNELCYVNKGITLLSIDPDTINPAELRLLKKECEKLELAHVSPITQDLYEILDFVYQQNITGKRPYHKDIATKFHASRTTAIKRLNKLKSMGLISDARIGIHKTLEVTEEGKRFLRRLPT